MNRAEPMRGRREAQLLEFPSVRLLADVLGRRCRDVSWARTSVASLDRFASLTGHADLEALLTRARRKPGAADAALRDFAQALDGFTRVQVAALAIGPKVWFSLNGVPVAWRSLPGAAWSESDMPSANPTDRLILLALVGSGLHRAELLRVRVRDVGSLDSEARIACDLTADPLALTFNDVRSKREYITFLTERAREALVAAFARRAATGETLDANSLLVAAPGGAPATRLTVAHAARRTSALIEAANNVNVEMCRKTGDFFRAWGLPGARFVPPADACVEEAP